MTIEKYYLSVDDTIKRDDVRGIYGVNIDVDYARQLGQSLAKIFRQYTAVEPVNVVIGHDMRLSGAVLAEGLGQGLESGGCRPIQMGLAGTELVGFLPAHYRNFIDGGIIITASHNPPDNNGFKFFGRGGLPLPLAGNLDAPNPDSPLERLSLSMKKRKIPRRLKWEDFAPDYIRTAIQKGELKFPEDRSGDVPPMKIAVEAGNGMGGRIMKEFAKLTPQFEWVFSNDMPDGRFPIIVPNPLQGRYQEMVAELIEKTGSDVGVCFDGDADRVALFDENGEMVSPPILAALIGQRLREKLGAEEKIAHNLVCSWVVADTLGDREKVVDGKGGTVITPVGYGKIKAIMHENPDVVFGAEHSGHYMFRDFYIADSGMLAGLVVLELAAELHAEGKTLSSVVDKWRSRYIESGEINFQMPASRPAAQVIGEAVERFQDEAHSIYAVAEDGVRKIKKYPPRFKQAVDDIRLEGENWWFCMRRSGTEGSGGGICRLYVEAVEDRSLMEQKRDELVNLIGDEYRIA
jgi:phosphomannomutase